MAESEATRVTYFGLVTRLPGKGFVVQFPDFPGCTIRRAKLDQVFGNAEEALRSQVDVFIRLEKRLPHPTSLEELKGDPENRSSFLIKFELEVPKSVRP